LQQENYSLTANVNHCKARHTALALDMVRLKTRSHFQIYQQCSVSL